LAYSVLPVLRKHGLVRQDWDLDEQAHAMRGLVTGFFQLTVNTMTNPAFTVEKP
jgi:prophage antirepressor-like protein